MNRVPAERARTAITWVTVVFLVTFAHHVYGGLQFGSPERTSIALVFSAVFAVTYLTYRLGSTMRWALVTFWFLTYGFWVAAVGLYEGGFNHTLFAVLRLLDANTLINELYPATGDARISGDVFFQGTGVLTFAAAVALAAAPFWSTKRPARQDGPRPATTTGAR